MLVWSRVGVCFALLLALFGLASGCSSADEEESACAKVCGCVVDALGASAQSQCQSECTTALSQSDPVGACVARLEANGVPQCANTCASAAPSNSSGVACEVDGDFVDDDCVGSTPRKMDCKTSAAQNSGFAVGCVREHADEPDDLDLCCPTSVSGSATSLGDFCAKCQTCVRDSGFSEGFCTPFRYGSEFSLGDCVRQGDFAELAYPDVSRAELSRWSCGEFDDYE